VIGRTTSELLLFCSSAVSIKKRPDAGKRRQISKYWHESQAIGSNHNKTAPIQKQFFGSLFQVFIFPKKGTVIPLPKN
jgi:hypothetical protein